MKYKTFTKNDLVKNLSHNTGFSKNFSKKLIDDLINIILLNLRNGELILKNLGSFKVLKKKERIGRNPKTKKEYIIKSRKSVIFTSSKNLEHNLYKS